MIPKLEIIFAIFVAVLGQDTSSFTITSGYSPHDPITWTRLEDRDSWQATSEKGLNYGIWKIDMNNLTVTLEGKTRTVDLSKFIKGDLDTTGRAPLHIGDHRVIVTDDEKGYTTIRTDKGGLLENSYTALKKAK